MRRCPPAVLLAALLLPPALAGPAAADPQGLLCSSSVVEPEKVPGDRWVAEVDAGPLLATDLPGAAGVEVELACTIQVSTSWVSRHSDPDAATVSSGPMRGVAVLPPSLVSFAAARDQNFFLCTAARVDGTTWYWDAGDFGGGAWSSGADAACASFVACSCAPPAWDVRIEDRDGDGDEEVVVVLDGYGSDDEPVADLDGDGDPDVVHDSPPLP